MLARWAVLSLAALLLAGCFTSERALITPATADRPLPRQARGEELDWNGTAWARKGGVTLRLDGTHYVLRPNAGDDDLRFLLKRVDDGVYIAQADDSGHILYGVMQRSGNMIYLHMFPEDGCAGLTADQIRRFGLTVTKEAECRVPSFDALASAMLTLVRQGRRPDRAYRILG